MSLTVVRRFVQAVSDQAVGVGLIRGVRPDQQLVKIVNDELVKLMGGEVSDLEFAKSGPTVILLAGLQGVGKTTVCAKLAFYLKKLVRTKFHSLKNINFLEEISDIDLSAECLCNLLILTDAAQITGEELHVGCRRCL